MTLIRLSSQIYAGALRLYPAELQEQFGFEMRELFREDLADAWRMRGVGGVAGVWAVALREVLTIALPGLKSNPVFIVPALAFVFEEISIAGEFRSIVVWPGIVVALTSAVIVRCARRRVISLGLATR